MREIIGNECNYRKKTRSPESCNRRESFIVQNLLVGLSAVSYSLLNAMLPFDEITFDHSMTGSMNLLDLSPYNNEWAECRFVEEIGLPRP